MFRIGPARRRQQNAQRRGLVLPKRQRYKRGGAASAINKRALAMVNFSRWRRMKIFRRFLKTVNIQELRQTGLWKL